MVCRGQTDLGAIIARSTGGIATEALDAARSGAVGLDQRIDHWVTRLGRQKGEVPRARGDIKDASARWDAPNDAPAPPLVKT